MISVEQIRAARSLLNWTQEHLATVALLSKPSINNIERKISKPRSETLNAIQKAFEKAGVEFIKGGARFREDALNIKVMDGDEGATRLLWDVIDTLSAYSGTRELLVSGVQEKKFIQSCGDNFYTYLKKVEQIGIQEKLLMLENDDSFTSTAARYRWVPPNIFSQVPYFVYADKYALILWGPPQKIILIENEIIADSYRRQFYAHWQQGKIPKEKNAKD